MNTIRIKLSAFLIFVMTIVIFSTRLSQQEIIAFDSRFYLFAQEMLRNGWSWFPTTYGEWYPDYPATSTWLIVGIAKLFGGLNKISALLPTIFFSALTLTFTYLIGRLQRERIGWAAIFFLLLTLFFMRTIRSISLDMMITAITTMTFYVVHANEVLQKSKRILWIYPLFLLGFLIRGPIGLVMPVGVMCAYYLVTKNYSSLIKRGMIALFILLSCIGLLILLADYVGGGLFIKDVLRMQVFGRLETASLPRYFYFIDGFGSYALAYPVAVIVLFAVVWQWFKSRTLTPDMRFIFLLSSWAIIILIGMSVPADKKVRYILPMLPACALIAATFYTSQTLRFSWLKKLLSAIFFILPTLFFAAIYWIAHTNETKSLSLPIAFHFCFLIFLLLQLLQIFVLWKGKRDDLAIYLLGIAAIAFTFFYLFVMEPAQLFLSRGRDAVQTIERLRAMDHAKLIFYRENPDGLPIKYVINMNTTEPPIYTSSLDELKKSHDAIYVVTSTSYSNDIDVGLKNEFKKIMTTKIAHVDIVVYKRT